MNDTMQNKINSVKLFNKLAWNVFNPTVFHPTVHVILLLLLNCINFETIIKFQLHKP